MDAMQQEFGGHIRRLYTHLHIFHCERETTSDCRHTTISTILYYCYFCDSGDNLVEHHITYSPEVTVTLCKSCHNKIHFVMKQQQEVEKQRLKSFTELEKWVDNSRPFFRANFVEK